MYLRRTSYIKQKVKLYILLNDVVSVPFVCSCCFGVLFVQFLIPLSLFVLYIRKSCLSIWSINITLQWSQGQGIYLIKG